MRQVSMNNSKHFFIKYVGAISLCLFLCTQPCNAFFDTIVIHKQSKVLDLSAEVQLLIDTSGKMTAHQVYAISDSLYSKTPVFKRSRKSNIWGRITIRNATSAVVDYDIAYDETHYAVSTYFIEAGKMSAANISGLFVGSVKRADGDLRQPARIVLAPGETIEVLYRVKSQSSFSISDPSEFQLAQRGYLVNSYTGEVFFVGLLIGILGLMLVFTFILHRSFRDKTLLYFWWVLCSLFLYFSVLYQLPFVNFMLHPHWAVRLAMFAPVIITISFTALFNRILNLRKNAIFFFWSLWFACAVLAVAMLRVWIRPTIIQGIYDLNYVLLLWLIVAYTGIIYSAVKGFKHALNLVFSTFFLLIGAVMNVLTMLFVIPQTFVGRHGLEIGALTFCTAILATVWRQIRRIQHEQHKANVHALMIAKEKEELITNMNTELELKVKVRTEELEKEKEASVNLLLNILPLETANELMLNGKTTAKLYSQVTVLFADVEGFTAITEKIEPHVLVNNLHLYFSAFDNIIKELGLEKIKTIGDAYVCVGNLPMANDANAIDVLTAAIRMNEKCAEFVKNSNFEFPFVFRFGIHTGPVIAGVVGIKKFQFDIWGDTVNIAARMEQHSHGGKINISQTTYDLIKDDFDCEFRGLVHAKNKGKIEMYFVKGRKNKEIY